MERVSRLERDIALKKMVCAQMCNFCIAYCAERTFNWYIMIIFFRPDLIKYEQLSKSNPHGNLNNAFNVAEEKLGITSLLEAEGMKRYNEINVFTKSLQVHRLKHRFQG